MASNELLAKREKIQNEIFALENTLRADSNIIDLQLSDSSSDDESDDSEPAADEVEQLKERGDLEAECQQVQREIEELENILGVDADLVDTLTEDGHDSDSSNEDSDDVELDLPQNVETCLQMNLVYQEVIKEKLAELENLLRENQQHQKEIEVQLSGPTTSSSSSPGHPSQKLFLGYFLKPYFKDKLTGLGPPANEETKERLSHGTRPIDEPKIKRWEVWQKALLTNAVVADTMKKLLQPKLSKLDYLSSKMSKAEDVEKDEIRNQIDLIEKDISDISAMREEQLVGDRNDDHDWEKISNIDFEGLRHAEDLKRFWQNFLHPSINKTVWKQEEIDKLREIVRKYNCCHWDKIAEALGTKRTAFMCFQTYQRYISKTFRRKEWTKEEDRILRDLVDKMRIGNFIPYMQMSYFMVGRDASQLSYRWTSVLDPSIKKGPWSKEEDQLLRNAVAKYGIKEWGKVRMEVPGRTDGACRDRYLDCLQENVKKGAWSIEEVELLKQKVEKYGVGKWTKIASEIPNRIDCQCLNKWKQLTQASQSKKRGRQQTTVRQHAKRRKVIQQKIKEEVEVISSEDEKQATIEYMDSEAEPDVPLDEDSKCEMIVKDYVQPDMKEWIPLNVRPLVNLSISGDDLKASISGHNRSENSICSPAKQSPVRYTILDRFGNVESVFVGTDATVLLNKVDSATIKVPVSDVKYFFQWKEASVMRKGKRKSPEDTKKKRVVRDWSNLNYELLKAIIPWIGNVILPMPSRKKKQCEADIIGIKAAEAHLLKTPVFSFFIKGLHIDAEGCKKVIEVRQRKIPRNTESNPKTVHPNTVFAALQERREKSDCKEYAKFLQHPQQPVHTQEMKTPTWIHPSSLVIPRPNMQGTLQPLLHNGQKISVPSQPPPQAIPLPLAQLTAPVQPVTTSASKSPSIENSRKNSRTTRRTRKPTKKAQVLIEEAKSKGCKKESLKQNGGNQSSVIPTITLHAQPINWLLTPGGLIQVTGMLSANISGNQMVKVPNDTQVNTSTQVTSTNPTKNPLSNPVVTSSSNSPILSSSISTSHVYTDHLMPSSSINIVPACRGLGLQTPISNILMEHKSKSPQASSEVHQNNSCGHIEASGTKSSTKTSDSAVDAALSSRNSNVAPAVTNVCVVPPSSVLSVPTLQLVSQPVISKPGGKVLVPKPQVVSQNICVPVTAIKQSAVIQNQAASNKVPNRVALTIVPQVRKPSEPQNANPGLPSNSLSFDPNLMFLDDQSKVDDWINGKGGVSLTNLEFALPYLPPSAASIKNLSCLLKAKQCLVAAAAQILPHEYQNGRREKEQVDATRKLVAEKFATNPAYLRLKARFLSCFSLSALLATINPCEDCELLDSPSRNDEDEVVDNLEE